MISITTCFAHRWSSLSSSLVIRNGSIMRRRLCSPTSVRVLSSFGCTQSSAFGGQPISSELQSGCLGRFCSPDIGTKDWGFSELLAHVSHSSRPRRSFRWAASAGGFPAMTEKVAFLMKDVVLFAVSVYLLRQDVIRASLFKTAASDSGTTVRQDASPTGAVAGC